MIALFKNKLTEVQQNKVNTVSQLLNINPNWLLATMYFETAGTLSPKKINSIGSVGLIQFTRDKAGVNYKTINGKRYLLSDIKKMSFNDQMDLVHEYFKEVKKTHKINLNSFLDVYFAVFFPLAIGQSSDYVFQTKGLKSSLIAKQNPIFDKNKDGQIQKYEVEQHFIKYYGDTVFTELKKKVVI